MIELTRLTIRRARQERLPQVAGALSFTTLLAVVPLLAVSLALFTHFPLFGRFEAALEQYLLRSLLPPEIARTVLRQLHQFAVNAGSLTGLGMLFLLVTSIAMLFTVENAFNQIWAVKRSRPLLQRIGVYALLLGVLPLALGISLWAGSAVLGASLGWIGPLPPGAHVLLDGGPALLGFAGLACLYRYLPNTKVRWRDAIVGGVLAAAAIELGKRGFTAWLLKIPTYKAVYGASAAFPLFLLWVYYSWLVTLAAALVTANLSRGGGTRRAD